MNIANIFGLHLNCRVKVYNAIADLLAVNKQGVVEIFTNGDDSSSLARVEDCKLILKPLSAITDEDKAEFMEKFNTNSYYHPIDDRTPIDIWRTVKREIKIKEGFWLCSKGYDIGLVPDEYKEVEE